VLQPGHTQEHDQIRYQVQLNKDMVKQNKSARHSSPTVWIGSLIVGGGLIVASSAALASPPFLGAPAQAAPPAQSQGKADQYPQLPEGQGKQTVVRVCGKCHSPTNVIANGQSRQGWEDTITKMAGLGATASDEEYTDILEYLVKNFPQVTSKVNMNKATTDDLEKQLGFSTKQAADIVAYRTKNGNFKSIEDLQKVPDLNGMDVASRKNRMTFE
jgi:competence protein ComEA